MTWPGLDLDVGCCPCPEVSAVKPQLRTQGAPGSLGETQVRSHSRVSQSVFTLVVLVVLVTLQVELLLGLVNAGSSQLTSNDLMTVQTFLIKHRHV